VGNLKKLQIFDASENKIEFLPDDISGCTALTDLHLSQNLLEELPDTIGTVIVEKIFNQANDGKVDNLILLLGCSKCLVVSIYCMLFLFFLFSLGKLKKLQLVKIDQNRLLSLTPAIGG